MIHVEIYDEHKLMGKGVELLLEKVPDFEVLFCTESKVKLTEFIKNRSLHILVFTIQPTPVNTGVLDGAAFLFRLDEHLQSFIAPSPFSILQPFSPTPPIHQTVRQ